MKYGRNEATYIGVDQEKGVDPGEMKLRIRI